MRKTHYLPQQTLLLSFVKLKVVCRQNQFLNHVLNDIVVQQLMNHGSSGNNQAQLTLRLLSLPLANQLTTLKSQRVYPPSEL